MKKIDHSDFKKECLVCGEPITWSYKMSRERNEARVACSREHQIEWMIINKIGWFATSKKNQFGPYKVDYKMYDHPLD